MPRQDPPQQPPPVQRLRVRYAKRGRLRFTSHRDFSRAFERAVFRARIPMAYSSGFNPHPRISYAGASPTGAASEAEYLELALAEVLVPAEVHELLDAAPEVTVERMTKRGLRSFDARGAVSSLAVVDAAEGAPTTVELVLRHGEPAVRADDILSGMTRLGGLDPAGPALLTRLDQGPYDEATGEVGDPFAS